MTFQKRVQRVKHQLTSIEWEIIAYLENYQESYTQLTLKSIATYCHVSTTTIFRLCQKLGLSGFSELKAVLKYQALDIPNTDKLAMNYHNVVDKINQYDTEKLFLKLKEVKEFYVLAETEKELRLAKEIQRIYQQDNYNVYILPSNQSFESMIPNLTSSLIWIIKIDSVMDFPIQFYQSKSLEEHHTVLFTYPKVQHVLFDDVIFIPHVELSQDSYSYDLLTPFVLSVEMMYLKYQLTKYSL